MNYVSLLDKIKEIFIEEDKYILRKIVEEFDFEGKFIADYYNFIMFEHDGTTAPTIYHVASPFDLVSKKAPQHAMVWKNGEIVLNTDYTEYAAMRTGAMDALTLRSTGISSLDSKNILVFGTGKTARWSVEILKASFPDLKNIHYINSSNTSDEVFEKFTETFDVQATIGNINNLETYDYILCHTNSKNVLIEKEIISKVKKGAVITTYISSSELGEVADEFYNSQVANIILDWDQNIEKPKDLLRAIDGGFVKKEEIIFLKDILSNMKQIDNEKEYSIFRFMGTPIQNLAVLKSLILK